MARADRSAGPTRRSTRLQDRPLDPKPSRHPPTSSSPSLAQQAQSRPTFPFELVREVLEVLYHEGGNTSALAACCGVSRAFVDLARPILWRTVVVECRNAVHPYWHGYAEQATLPWFSAEFWDLAERTRRQLRLLVDNVELGALVRHFTMADPNGVDRVNTAQLWPHDIALLQDAVLRLQAVESVRIGSIRGTDYYDLCLPAHNPHLHTLRMPTITLHDDFDKSYPKLRRLYIDMCACDIDLRPSGPPITSLTIRQDIHAVDSIFSLFGRTLTHLELDCVSEWHEIEEHLSSDAMRVAEKLTHITIVLRGGCQVKNEEMRWPTFIHFNNQPRDGDDLPTILRFLDHLPRPQQVTLTLKLPPLADPELREDHKAFWADVLEEMRGDGRWDEMLPRRSRM